MALDTILVPYDGSAPAAAMLRLACHASGGRGRVIVVSITRVPSSLPLDPVPAWMDAAGNAALDHAEAVAARLGVPIETWLTRVRYTADAIAGEARIQEVDAVFLPLCSWRYPLRRLRALHLAHAVARQVSCAVLLGACLQGPRRDAAADTVESRRAGPGAAVRAGNEARYAQ